MKLDGVWYNELGSKMVLRVEAGAITGTYETLVGDARGSYRLVGRTETTPSASQSVAFVVCWDNETVSNRCCTAWCGQLQLDGRGDETIATTWLLRGDGDATTRWKSTIVGQDLFRRQPPDKGMTVTDWLRAPSHPRGAVGT
jgi:hypothetical protein